MKVVICLACLLGSLPLMHQGGKGPSKSTSSALVGSWKSRKDNPVMEMHYTPNGTWTFTYILYGANILGKGTYTLKGDLLTLRQTGEWLKRKRRKYPLHFGPPITHFHVSFSPDLQEVRLHSIEIDNGGHADFNLARVKK